MPTANHDGQRTPTVSIPKSFPRLDSHQRNEVLVASMHDLRHFSSLLKGVNFVDVSKLTFWLRSTRGTNLQTSLRQ